MSLSRQAQCQERRHRRFADAALAAHDGDDLAHLVERVGCGPFWLSVAQRRRAFLIRHRAQRDDNVFHAGQCFNSRASISDQLIAQRTFGNGECERELHPALVDASRAPCKSTTLRCSSGSCTRLNAVIISDSVTTVILHS
jgi:hypothetical protein